MTERVQVAVVGGGIVGCSVLYGLARLGVTDTLLLERRDLTSGSTWHAAGNVTYFGHYPEITQLYINSIKAYRQASEESGHDISLHRAGSLRLATTQAELDAYRRLEPLYDELKIPYHVLKPKEIEDVHPLLVTDGLLGAAQTPTDGHVDPSGATHALAKAARQRGAHVRTRCPVVSMRQCGDVWEVKTKDGLILADQVVVATSFWAREMLAPLGVNLPIYPLQHHEIITGPVAELEELEYEVPTVRDPWAPSNTRQERNGYLCGVYERHPEFWAVEGIPPDFTEELLEPDMERLEPHLLRVMERLPSFGTAGVKTVNNGPICYAPDGCPLLGPVESHRGLWLATGFTIGIGTGGGSGEFLAHWIANGKPMYELPIVYPSRFSNAMTRDQILKMIRATYANGYSIPEQT